MLSGNHLLVFLAFFASTPVQHYPLPQSATISIGPTQHDAKDPTAQNGFCDDYHLTEKQVREQFRTYHPLGPVEFESYLFLPCWIDGTVQVHGKTYTWRSRMGNTLWTTWPNGKDKQLGGKPTDDPSGK